MPENESADYDQPVAYDKDGHPLYAHPPTQQVQQPAITQQSVHIARPVTPEVPVISDDVAKRHQESVAKYPNLNLSGHEYVMMEVEKHWIGTVGPIAVGSLLGLFICVAVFLIPSFAPHSTVPFPSLLALAALVLILIAIGTYIPVWVYRNNRFYLTNESAIQDIQASLFARQEQTVSLGSVEDVSYHQSGIVQLLFDYGTVRLSTIGDEDTYTFTYVSRPKEKTALLNNAVEAFKNGRPVGD